MGITAKRFKLGISIRTKASPPQTQGFLPLDRATRTVQTNTKASAKYSKIVPIVNTFC